MRRINSEYFNAKSKLVILDLPFPLKNLYNDIIRTVFFLFEIDDLDISFIYDYLYKCFVR